MTTERSSAFQEFNREQTRVNRIFWSSEVAHEIVKQRFLTPAMLKTPESIKVVFSELECNAFIPPVNGKASHYERTAKQFKDDLDKALEATSKLVIVDMHRAFERFLTLRANVQGLPEDRRKTLRKYLKRGGSIRYQADLRQLCGLSATKEVPFHYFLDARIYHEVRHDIAHADDPASVNLGAGPWVDQRVLDCCTHNAGWNGKTIFPNSTPQQRAGAIERVCTGAQKKQKKHPSEPLIFFYALFCLGAYHRLARTIDESLPPMEK